MSQRIEGKNLHIKFENDTIKELDRIAGRVGLKRADLVRKLLDLGIDVFRGYEKIGLVKLIEIKNRANKTLQKDITPTLF